MTCPFCISYHVNVCSDMLVLFIKLDIDIFFSDNFFLVKLIMTFTNFWSSSFSINNLGKKIGD